MNLVIITLSIVIVICVILILAVSSFNKFQDYIIRINEAEANIDSVLRKRFDLLNKSIWIIKSNIETDKEILELIVGLRSKKLTNFDLDRQLYDAINEFNNYAEENEELKQCEAYMKIDINLIESESEIVALRKYYNDIITDYNKMVRSFPTNVVALIKKYKTKTYFDGKNMEDDVINDFKL